jgi:hypothetical protein
MTDRAQFEAMLNALINEDQEAAKEIFHNIVVAKSREIYAELLESDFSEASEEEEEEMEGSEPKAPKDTGNPYASDEEEGEEEEEEGEDEEGADEFGGEEEGEEEGDGEEEFGGEEEGEDDGAIEDRVMDLEDALEDLKAEFEQLLSQEGEEGNHDIDAIHAAGDEMGGDDMGMGGDDEMDEFAGLMEYTIKVPSPKHGDNGVNTKSLVAKKNDMGGTTANIAQGHEESGKGGTAGGLLKPTTQEENFGNINVPGGKAGKTGFTKREPGHGAEKKGASEKADNKNSMINGAPGRAK